MITITKRVEQYSVNVVSVTDAEGVVVDYDLEPWAKYIAVNANGRMKQYECIPHGFKTSDSWFSSNTYGKVMDVCMTQIPVDYTTTMQVL